MENKKFFKSWYTFSALLSVPIIYFLYDWINGGIEVASFLLIGVICLSLIYLYSIITGRNNKLLILTSILGVIIFIVYLPYFFSTDKDRLENLRYVPFLVFTLFGSIIVTIFGVISFIIMFLSGKKK